MDRIVEIVDGFWNIRGSQRLAGVFELGTHSSLVRLASGRFVLLDSYGFDDAVANEVLRLTEQGTALEAVINLHPFHTLHVEAIARRFPAAKLYGTTRHIARFPGLVFQPQPTESAAFAALYAHDFDFSVPQGVAFAPKNESLHFASVLAIHRASGTLHVDDTFSFARLPFGLSRLSLHPTLRFVLEPGAESAAKFRAWGERLVAQCGTVKRICTAHTTLPEPGEVTKVAEHLRTALARAEPVLRRHELRAARST